MQDVTSKVAPSVSSSFKEIGSSTKEVWLDPLREITRDIAGDVREAFRPGGASEAHASLRATAADARGATPRNVAASASSRDAAGASALSFRGGIGWEPSPSSEPPSAGERLESIFAALEAGEGDTDLEAAERGAATTATTRRFGVPNEIEEEPVPSGDGDADADARGSDATALLRDETADAFSRLGALRLHKRSDDDARELIGALMRRATATPGAAVALAAAAAALVVVLVARDHSLRAARMVDAGGVGGEPGGSEPAPETPPPPIPL